MIPPLAPRFRRLAGIGVLRIHWGCVGIRRSYRCQPAHIIHDSTVQLYEATDWGRHLPEDMDGANGAKKVSPRNPKMFAELAHVVGSEVAFPGEDVTGHQQGIFSLIVILNEAGQCVGVLPSDPSIKTNDASRRSV